MSADIRVFFVKSSGLVVAYGTMDWDNGADWDPAVHGVAPSPPTVPDSEPFTVGPGPALVFNWRFDAETGAIVDA